MNELIKIQPQTTDDSEIIGTVLADKFNKALDELYNTYPSFLYVLQTIKLLLSEENQYDDEPDIVLEFSTHILAVANEIILDKTNSPLGSDKEKLNHIRELQTIVQLVKSYNAYDGMLAYSLDTLYHSLQFMTWTIITVYGGPRTARNTSLATKTTKTYIVRNNTNGLIKIGRSRDVERRVRSLSTAAGSELELLCTIDKDIENELHHKFSNYRTTGEWFDDKDGEIVSYIKQLL